VGGANPIPDGYMTASSIYSTSYQAHFARLHGTGGWGASQAELDAPVPNIFLQVSSDTCKTDCVVLHVTPLIPININ